MTGFKDFYQYASTTRVIAGRDLLSSTGFEFQKEGARRVFVVTDEVIRGTGLVDRIEAGVTDGGLEVVGVYDRVPQDSSTHVCDECAAAAKEAGADSFLAIGGGSVMDTAKVADAVFTHGGSAREQEGFFLMPRDDDGMGRPHDIAPLACIPTTSGTGSEISMAAVIKDPDEKVKIEIADFPLFPRLAILDPDTTRTPAAEGGRRHGHGRRDARDRGIRLDRLEPAPGRALAARPADDPRQHRARRRARRGGRGGARQHADRGQPRHDDRARLGARDVAPGRRPVRRAARRGQRDPPAARDPAQRAGSEEIADRYRDIGEVFDIAEPDIGAALAAHITGLVDRLGLPTRLSQVGVPEDGIPALVEGADGRRHDAA
jgi:alcohol dehydrogenase class IV